MCSNCQLQNEDASYKARCLHAILGVFASWCVTYEDTFVSSPFNLVTGNQIHIDIEKGYIKAPEDPGIPIICVGPGTGVAPMRALIGDRVYDGARGE